MYVTHHRSAGQVLIQPTIRIVDIYLLEHYKSADVLLAMSAAIQRTLWELGLFGKRTTVGRLLETC